METVTLNDLKKEATIEKPMNIYQKLLEVQAKLKAPKNQWNTFGKYHYRSCEDILEGVKPLLKEVNASLVVKDELVQVGDRYYIKATATFIDVESNEFKVLHNTAYAREEETKKGMDGGQITGTASSYARKYALNGLLLIDDTKDSDTDENKLQQPEGENEAPKKETLKDVTALIKEWQLCRTKMFDLGIDFRSETIKQWIADKTGYGNQEASQDCNHMKAIVDAYHHLIKGKEAKGGKSNDQ